MQRIYLDNASTSWPKPAAVYEAIDRHARQCGAAAGRGAYRSAGEAQRVVIRCRRLVARLIGADEPQRVVFTAGCTQALNLAIAGVLRPGGHAVTTAAEHNSVLRPLAMLRDSIGVRVDYAPCDDAGYVDPDGIDRLVTPDTQLVAFSAASNVTGALQDVAAVAAVCRRNGVPLLVDAAQSLGHHPIDVSKTGVDLLAAPGHKGLLGPLGVGVLYVGPKMVERMRPTLVGGGGDASDSEQPPDEMPHRFEAGNLNAPAIAGLAAGIDARGRAGFSDAAMTVTDRLVASLGELPGVRVLGPARGEPRVPVVSLNIHGYDPQEIAAALDTTGVECRAGLHCAARIHQAIGSDAAGGTVRLSPGFSTTSAEADATIQVIRQLATSC